MSVSEIWSLPAPAVTIGTGLADAPVQGTGVASPRGVESWYEYNGLSLNIRRWLDTILINQIDGFGDADVRDARDVNPGFHGETAFNSLYGGRTVVLTGRVRAYSLNKLRDLQQALRQAFSDLGAERELVIRTGNPEADRIILCKKSSPIAMVEVQSNFQYTREFQITLRASNPRILSYMQEYVSRGVDYFVNGVGNPSMETNITGWQGWNQAAAAGVLSRITGDGKFGTASIQYQVAASPANNRVQIWSSDPLIRTSVTPGQPCLVRAYAKVPSAQNGPWAAYQLKLGVQFTDAAGNGTGGGWLESATTNPTSTTDWYELVAAWGSVPAGSVYALPYVEIIVGAAGGGNVTLRADGFQVIAGTSDKTIPYFDGSYSPLGGTTGVSWSGTAHASSSIYQPSAAYTVANDGNFRAQPIFDLTGPITNPTITNDTNGEQIKMNGSIPAGETWTFDTAARTIKSSAAGNPSKMSLLDVTSEFIELEPGANKITVAGTARSAATTFTSRHRHAWI